MTKWARWTSLLLLRPFLFIFMQFSGKTGQIIGWHPLRQGNPGSATAYCWLSAISRHKSRFIVDFNFSVQELFYTSPLPKEDKLCDVMFTMASSQRPSRRQTSWRIEPVADVGFTNRLSTLITKRRHSSFPLRIYTAWRRSFNDFSKINCWKIWGYFLKLFYEFDFINLHKKNSFKASVLVWTHVLYIVSPPDQGPGVTFGYTYIFQYT